MEIDELWEKLTRLEQEKLSFTQTISELEASKESLSKEVEELTAKNQSLEKKLTSSKGQLAHCEEELNESKDLNMFLQDQIDEIKMQASMDQLSRTSLFSEISDLSATGVDDVDEPYKKLDAVPTKLIGTVASLHGSPKPLQASSSLGLGVWDCRIPTNVRDHTVVSAMKILMTVIWNTTKMNKMAKLDLWREIGISTPS